MNKRWLIYCLIGLVFGVVDWYYLDLLAHFSWGQLGESPLVIPIIIALNYGIWFVPVLPIAIYEVHRSKSARLSAVAGITVWSSAIFSYYTYYTALLAFWGLPHMDYLLIFGKRSPTFWQDWARVFQKVILSQFFEWVIIAVIGGGIVGLVASRVYFYWLGRRTKVLSPEAR